MLGNKTNFSVTSYNSIKLFVPSCISTSYLISSYQNAISLSLFECVFLIPHIAVLSLFSQLSDTPLPTILFLQRHSIYLYSADIS